MFEDARDYIAGFLLVFGPGILGLFLLVYAMFNMDVSSALVGWFSGFLSFWTVFLVLSLFERERGEWE